MSYSQGIIAASFIGSSAGRQVTEAVPWRLSLVDTLRVKEDIAPVEEEATLSGRLVFNEFWQEKSKQAGRSTGRTNNRLAGRHADFWLIG